MLASPLKWTNSSIHGTQAIAPSRLIPMNIQTLFPTLIGIDQADQETIEAIAREVLQQRARLEGLLAPTWGDNVLSSFEREKDLFTALGLPTLKSFVEGKILEFAQSTRVNKQLQIDDSYTQSWINITRRFGFQERHNHERGADGLPISGAYYYNTNGQDGDFSVVPTDMQAKHFGNYVIKPQVGRLVLFRSEVFHRVSANMTESDRISFSFNYLLKNA